MSTELMITKKLKDSTTEIKLLEVIACDESGAINIIVKNGLFNFYIFFRGDKTL